MIGAVTAGLCRSQARATSVGFSPISLQNFSQASSLARFSSLSSSVSFEARRPSLSFFQDAA
jgi:hypothetical protein